MLNDFGVEVTVIEYADRIIPTEDKEFRKKCKRLLKKKGITFVTSAKVLPETLDKREGVTISAEMNGETKAFKAEKMLVSVGDKRIRRNWALKIRKSK